MTEQQKNSQRLAELVEQAKSANMLNAGAILKEAFEVLVKVYCEQTAEIERLKAEVRDLSKTKADAPFVGSGVHPRRGE